jgi:hypothetical protein
MAPGLPSTFLAAVAALEVQILQRLAILDFFDMFLHNGR